MEVGGAQISGFPKRILLLVNPGARRGSDMYKTAADRLEALGFRVIRYPRAKPDEFAEIIRLNARRADAVILGGGDGTVHAALKAIVAASLPFGIIPLGTANNLARSLGIPADIDEALRVLAMGNLKRIDLGVCNGEFFLNVAGLGLSTAVNRHVPPDLKRRFGVLAYIWYALKVFRRFKPFSARITCDGESRVVRTLQISVCNGRHYGAGLTIAEDATIDDGRLDLCSTQLRHWWQGLKLIGAMLKGRYDGRKEIRLMQGAEIRIETRKPLRIDTDGEVKTRTPAVLKVLPGVLRVFAPLEESQKIGLRESTVTEKPQRERVSPRVPNEAPLN